MPMPETIRIETRKRGVFGTLMWWLFLLFNLVMVAWTTYGCAVIGSDIEGATEAPEQAGAIIGGGLAIGMILSIWFFGAIILGLIVALTRGKKVTVERTVD